MINYKKADAYFVKRITKEEVFIWTPPAPDTGVWLATKHIAVYYPDFNPLPVDPARCREQPGLAHLLVDMVKAETSVKVTPFTWELGAAKYRVISGRRLLHKDLVDILGIDLKMYHQRVSKGDYFVTFDADLGVVGFACGYMAPAHIWEVLGL